MKPLLDLTYQLQVIAGELTQADIEEELRNNPPPVLVRVPWLDLSGFDLSDPKTRSQLLDEPRIPEKISTEERFAPLIKNLRFHIHNARTYLHDEGYPQAQKRIERVQKIEDALMRLNELATSAKIEPGYYLPDTIFVRNDQNDYCWSCATSIIKKTRTGLVLVCLVLLRHHPKLLSKFWLMCNNSGWWRLHYLYIQPWDRSSSKSSEAVTCRTCDILLCYSLSAYGVCEEADYFLSYRGDMKAKHWLRLWAVFYGAREADYPNYIAQKLEQLIAKYQIDSPRSAVAEKVWNH